MLTSTTGLALVNWSQEDLVICSVPISNHLTFLMTVTLSSQRFTIHRRIGAPVLPPKSFLEHIGQYHVIRGQTILTYDWWWCLIVWLLPGRYDHRIEMVEGHIQGWPFTFRTCEQEEKTKDPSHMAPSSSAKLPVEEAPESWMHSGIDYRRSGGEWELKSPSWQQ